MPSLADRYGAALQAIVQELDAPSAKKAVKKFVALLKERNQLSLAPKAVAAYERAARKAEGIEELRFTSAEEISETERRRIAKDLEKSVGKKLEVDWRVDASLVAGAVIRYGDTLMDGSIKGKLDRLKRSLA